MLHWDPFTEVRLARVVQVDLDIVRESSGLGPDALFALTSSVYSDRTRMQTHGGAVEFGELTGRVRAPISVSVPGSRAGGRLTVTTRLVLRSPGRRVTPISPSRPGAILWTDDKRISLEGGAARFPVTALDFTDVPGLPTGAAWALEWNPEDLDAPMLGGLRLLVNSGDDALVAALRTGGDDISAVLLRSFVTFDVARSMVHAALANEHFIEAPEGFAEGTIGRTLFELVAACWPATPVPTLVARCRDDPARLDADIQAHVGVLPS